MIILPHHKEVTRIFEDWVNGKINTRGKGWESLVKHIPYYKAYFPIEIEENSDLIKSRIWRVDEEGDIVCFCNLKKTKNKIENIY